MVACERFCSIVVNLGDCLKEGLFALSFLRENRSLKRNESLKALSAGKVGVQLCEKNQLSPSSRAPPIKKKEGELHVKQRVLPSGGKADKIFLHRKPQSNFL